MAKIFDYYVDRIEVSHPRKKADANGQRQQETDKYVLRCHLVCVDFDAMQIWQTYQNDGKASNETLKNAVLNIMSDNGKADVNTLIANAKDNKYVLTEQQIEQLMSYGPRKKDLTLIKACQLVDYKLPVPMCMKYSQELNGHAAGTWVCNPNSDTVKLFTSFQVLCQTFGEPDNFLANQRPEDVAEQRIRQMYSIRDAKKNGAVFNEDELRKYGLTDVQGMNVPDNIPEANAITEVPAI